MKVAIVIEAWQLIWPLVTLIVGLVVWTTRGARARQRRLAEVGRRRAALPSPAVVVGDDDGKQQEETE